MDPGNGRMLTPTLFPRKRVPKITGAVLKGLCGELVVFVHAQP